jgi:hypothetical protein
MLRACPHFLLDRECNSLSLFLPLSPSFSLFLSHFLSPISLYPLSLSLTPERGAHTLFTGQRERERERGRERERKREGKRDM